MIDLISRQAAIDALGEEPEIWNDTEEEWAYRNAWVEHISAIKSIPSATCDDCIWHVCNYNKIDWDGEDGYISRKDALKPFCVAPDGTRIPEVDCDNFPVEFSVGFIKKHLLSLPSAPKTGKWILDPNGMDWNIPAWRCSECGYVANYIGVEANGLGNNPMNWAGSKFCPNCGARMKGADDE